MFDKELVGVFGGKSLEEEEEEIRVSFDAPPLSIHVSVTSFRIQVVSSRPVSVHHVSGESKHEL